MTPPFHLSLHNQTEEDALLANMLLKSPQQPQQHRQIFSMCVSLAVSFCSAHSPHPHVLRSCFIVKSFQAIEITTNPPFPRTHTHVLVRTIWFYVWNNVSTNIVCVLFSHSFSLPLLPSHPIGCCVSNDTFLRYYSLFFLVCLLVLLLNIHRQKKRSWFSLYGNDNVAFIGFCATLCMCVYVCECEFVCLQCSYIFICIQSKVHS